MPKNSPEVVFKPIFLGQNWSFFTVLAIICVKMPCNNLRQQLRRAEWSQWFGTCIQEWLALVSPSQLLAQKSYGQNAT